MRWDFIFILRNHSLLGSKLLVPKISDGYFHFHNILSFSNSLLLKNHEILGYTKNELENLKERYYYNFDILRRLDRFPIPVFFIANLPNAVLCSFYNQTAFPLNKKVFCDLSKVFHTRKRQQTICSGPEAMSSRPFL